MKNKVISIFIIFILVFICFESNILLDESVTSYSLSDIPDYNGQKYIILNDNNPYFNIDDYSNESFEEYGELDNLGRCTYAFANIGYDLMPTKEREYIGYIKPSGWQYTKYDFIDGKYLYNRCHLIAYQLTGENGNKNNLITCTRSMNSVTMVEFENMVANYIRKTKNHVLYKVTPVFKGDNLIATGVRMEAESIEDHGESIKFNVFIYNVEDKIEINYLDGTNKLS